MLLSSAIDIAHSSNSHFVFVLFYVADLLAKYQV